MKQMRKYKRFTKMLLTNIRPFSASFHHQVKSSQQAWIGQNHSGQYAGQSNFRKRGFIEFLY